MNKCVNQKLCAIDRHFRALKSCEEDKNITEEDKLQFRNYQAYHDQPELFKNLDKPSEEESTLSANKPSLIIESHKKTASPIQWKRTRRPSSYSEESTSSDSSSSDSDESSLGDESEESFGGESEGSVDSEIVKLDKKFKKRKKEEKNNKSKEKKKDKSKEKKKKSKK